MRIFRKHVLLKIVDDLLGEYPTNSNLNYFWNMGIFSAFNLLVQIISGVILGMHYFAYVYMSFSVLEHIMRDVNFGWLIRYIHCNGASMFFIVVYIHMLRGYYYSSYSYPREGVWISGVIILFIMILTAFVGYVLPWGQMSLWGATVITNLASVVPIVGKELVYLLWGGYSVHHPTLNRFYSIHFLLPFILLVLVIVHILLLHQRGSSNPLGVYFSGDTKRFTPYFLIKDLSSIFMFIIFFGVFVFFMPNILGHPDNYIEGNPLVTPSHIVPEWYFLFFYAILRSIPSKMGGILAMLGIILNIIFLPLYLQLIVKVSIDRKFYKIGFWVFLIVGLLLGWIGSCEVKTPFYEVGQFFTLFVFIKLLVFLWVYLLIETYLFYKNSFYKYLLIMNKNKVYNM